ncbi:hypothetical protein J6590_064709 [Homalodisca vitripennis]|nr:hypothetical protein J6590_064709 [Homalodisca vitripennis]
MKRKRPTAMTFAGFQMFIFSTREAPPHSMTPFYICVLHWSIGTHHSVAAPFYSGLLEYAEASGKGLPRNCECSDIGDRWSPSITLCNSLPTYRMCWNNAFSSIAFHRKPGDAIQRGKGHVK